MEDLHRVLMFVGIAVYSRDILGSVLCFIRKVYGQTECNTMMQTS